MKKDQLVITRRGWSFFSRKKSIGMIKYFINILDNCIKYSGGMFWIK